MSFYILNSVKKQIHNIQKNQRGLTLVEILLAVAILMLILPLAFTFLSYTSQAFIAGEEQTDLQQNLRMLSDYIIEEIKYSQEIEFIEDPDYEEDWEYIFLDEGKIFHHKEGSSEELFQQIDEKITITELNFNTNADESSRTLGFSITAKRDDREITVNPTVQLLNTEFSETDYKPVVKYKSPAPPSPFIKRINTFDSYDLQYRQLQREHYQDDEPTIYIEVNTEHIEDEDDAEAHLTEVLGPDESDYSDQVEFESGEQIVDNTAEIEFSFDEDNPSGTYKLTVQVEREDESASMSELYWILPTAKNIEVSPGEFAFDPQQFEHSNDDRLEVSPDVDSVEISVTLHDNGDSLTIDDDPVSSGEHYETSLGEEGSETEVEVEVISSDGSLTTEYSLGIYRQESASLSPNTTDYNLSEPEDIQVDIEYNGAESVQDITGESITADDWDVSNDSLYIYEDFLSNFAEGDKVTLTVKFDSGDDAPLTVNIVDNE